MDKWAVWAWEPAESGPVYDHVMMMMTDEVSYCNTCVQESSALQQWARRYTVLTWRQPQCDATTGWFCSCHCRPGMISACYNSSSTLIINSMCCSVGLSWFASTSQAIWVVAYLAWAIGWRWNCDCLLLILYVIMLIGAVKLYSFV